MGTLRDEVYEKLDYLSQLTEIVVSPQNEILGRLPDELELTFEQIKRMKSNTWSRSPSYELSLYGILSNLVSSKDYFYLNDIIPHFALKASDDLELDFTQGTMVGTIRLIKVNSQIEEKRLLEIAVNNAQRALNSYTWSSKNLRDRIITVLNTLEPGHGITWGQSFTGRVSSMGCDEIRELLSDVILENKWRIRDTNTIIKMGEWINSYLMSGDNVGLMNLLKLKIMVDKDLPIYSVDEVKNAKPVGTID